MSRQTRGREALGALALATVLVASACRDSTPPTAPDGGEGGPELAVAAQAAAADPLLAHAQEIPGFGGLFLDASGEPTVYLTDEQQKGAAQRALAATLREHGKDPARLRVRKAKYDYKTLHGWHSKGGPRALSVPGAVYADLDESTNRLRIGVESPAAAAGVRSALAAAGVPAAAVLTETAEPISFAVTLRDKVNPKRGGLQIHFGNFLCTLGFNTRPVGSAINSFITNSHCTNVQGGVEGTLYHQNIAAGALNQIGREVADPLYFVGGLCPPGRRCRYSDAARAQYFAGVPVDHGGIARTLGLGSIVINPANPLFNIVAEAPAPLMNQVLNKMGRTTGWSRGAVIGTCATVNVAGTNITLFCQDRVAAPVGAGDSGSPVFFYPGTGTSVRLHGILWGGNTAGTQFVFSRMRNIELELGPLTTF